MSKKPIVRFFIFLGEDLDPDKGQKWFKPNLEEFLKFLSKQVVILVENTLLKMVKLPFTRFSREIHMGKDEINLKSMEKPIILSIFNFFSIRTKM